jgi:hypothetical protein
MTKYTIQTGNVKKEINEKTIEAALKSFFSGLKASQFGILVSVEYMDGKESVTKMAPVEISLKRLGLYSKYEKEIVEMRKNNKKSTRDVNDYE